MRKRSIHRRLTMRLMAVVAVALFTAVPAATAQDPVDDSGDDDRGALEQLTDCVAEAGHLSVLLLMDESGSLQITDPANDRIIAAQSAITTLAGLAEADTSTVVEVRVAGFAQDYTAYTDWVELDDAGLAALNEETNQFAQRNTGLDTDFASAFIGAQTDIDARRAQLEKSETESCATIMTFTDGKYDIEPRSGPETKPYAPDYPLNQPGNPINVQVIGIDELCKDNGVMGSLRGEQVPVITVALTQNIDPGGQALIQAITTGKGPGTDCGPQVAGAGEYIAAADLGEVLGAFSSVASQIAGGSVIEEGKGLRVCALEPCDEGTKAVRISADDRRVNLLITTDVPAIDLHVTAPDANKPTVLSSDTESQLDTPSYVAAAEWLSPTAVSVDIEPRDDAAHGKWTIALVSDDSAADGTPAKAQVTRYSDLFPRLAKNPKIDAEGRIVIAAEIVDSKGDPVDETPTKTKYTATLVNEPDDRTVLIPLQPTPKGLFTGRSAAPGFGPAFDVVLTLDVTTDTGTVLPTQTNRTSYLLDALEAAATTSTTAPDAVAFADPTDPPAESLGGENTSGGSSPNFLIIGLIVLAGVGTAVWWVRKAFQSVFNTSHVNVAEIPILVRSNGRVERTGEMAGDMQVLTEDLVPLEVGDKTRTFETNGLRFSVFLPRNPFGQGEGRVSSDRRMTGSLGRELDDEISVARVGFDLRSEWVFELDEESSLAGTDISTQADVYGRLVLFLTPNNLVSPPESFRDSLNDDLPRRARALLVEARPNRGPGDEDVDMLDYLDRLSVD